MLQISPSIQKKGGFALVTSLVLMALLVLLAVGVLSLSAISTRSIGRDAALAEARDNARMALALAIGDLQVSVGPDQRVTTTADIAGDSSGNRLAPGLVPMTDLTVIDENKGLTSLQVGTRHWTGAWSLDPGAVPADQLETLGIHTRTPRPSLIGWLVSNDPLAAPPQPDSQGAALDAEGQPVDPQTTAVLVGGGTLGSSQPDAIDDFVAAPMLRVQSSGVGVGAYAWWVGDEGVKSAINIADSGDTGSYAALTGGRRAWETVDGLESYPVSAASSSLSRLASFRTAELLLPDTRPALQRNFHSATEDSRGVIADSWLGGTRIDLTAALAAGLPNLPGYAGLPNPPLAGTKIIPNSVAPSMAAPLWDTVKSFQDRQAQGSELLVRPGSHAGEPSVSPLVVDFRLLLGARLVPEGERATATGFRIQPCAKIAIAVANPYSVPLRWDQHLEVEFQPFSVTQRRLTAIWNSTGTVGQAFYLPANASEVALLNNAIFRIPPGSLAPGQALAFTQGSPVIRPRNTSRLPIDLVPFATSTPFDYNNRLELTTNHAPFTPPLLLDVRESIHTSMLTLEMRLAGQPSSSRPLLRLEKFELDNGFFAAARRSIPSAESARELEEPFPLMLYSFHVNQPGADYASLLPAGHELGLRSSAVRSFMDFNLQASLFPKHIASYNPAPFFMESTAALAQLPQTPPGGDTGTAFTRNLVANPLPWGRSPFGPQRTILFDPPQAGIASIAQLQHADLTGDDRAASISHQPGNAVGNSYAPIWVRRDRTIQPRTDYDIRDFSNPQNAVRTTQHYYDLAYLLNASLWDSYFFSTMDPSGQPASPAMLPINPSMDGLVDPMASAANLMIRGAFNVNSTSVEAWKALLGSSRLFSHPADSGDDADGFPFPRSLRQTDPASLPPSGTGPDSFSGYRRITGQQLDELAEEMVRQVRLRGPFLSLSHFVNRALADASPSATTADIDRRRMLTRTGALQAAIDGVGINIPVDGSSSGFDQLDPEQDRARLAWKGGAPRADLDGGRNTPLAPLSADPGEPDWAVTSRDGNYGAMAGIAADRWMLSDPPASRELGSQSTGIPGWLTQADVLQVIGPSLSARSDTFRVRTYGEARSREGRVLARAWCEAIVQRIPDYVDPVNAATDRGAALSPLNHKFGRRFEIVSFRWLSDDEI